MNTVYWFIILFLLIATPLGKIAFHFVWLIFLIILVVMFIGALKLNVQIWQRNKRQAPKKTRRARSQGDSDVDKKDVEDADFREE